MVFNIKNALLRRGTVDYGFSMEVSDFTLERGEFLCLLGPSGCGKSTLLDMLGLVFRPISAELFDLHINGRQDIRAVHQLGTSELMRIRRNHFGYILQSGGLIQSMSVRENIMISVIFSDRCFDKPRFSSLIDLLDIGPLLGRKPRDLSGGQRQRVAIARSLVHGPSVVLADEPTAAVDHKLSMNVCGALRDASRELGASVVMVTHNQEIASNFADRIWKVG
jgi:putative ABC transport system ATP-binding protein